MHRSTWKSGERRIARIFGTERNPLSGGNSKHTRSDSLHKKLFLETKHRTTVPGDKLWRNTLNLAKKEKKIPVIIYLKKGYPNPVIMCKLCDIKMIANEMIEDIKEENEEVNNGNCDGPPLV